MSGTWHIGVIGGSGLAAGFDLEDAQEIAVDSPFGEPSGPVTIGTVGGVRFTFLARHGAGHSLPPSSVNYRANIDVLKRCGVTDLLALCAIGSLREAMAPGHFVAVDQFIDRTTARAGSFFGPGLVGHVGLADPVCARLSALATGAARECGATVHERGTYVAIEGPQFSTRAESMLYRSWGCDVIGMTAMPEAKLAREAELPYALVGMVTDYDCWRAETAHVEVSSVIAQLGANADQGRALVQHLATILPAERATSPIDTVLDYALITDPAKRDPALLAKLDAVCGRIF